jgi:hypothetical protein
VCDSLTAATIPPALLSHALRTAEEQNQETKTHTHTHTIVEMAAATAGGGGGGCQVPHSTHDAFLYHFGSRDGNRWR